MLTQCFGRVGLAAPVTASVPQVGAHRQSQLAKATSNPALPNLVLSGIIVLGIRWWRRGKRSSGSDWDRCSRLQRREGPQVSGPRLPTNLYELMGVRPGADKTEIRRAYLLRQKVFHPDVAGAVSVEMCALLNAAYEFLTSPKDRAAYNMQLGMGKLQAEAAGADPDDIGPTWKWRPKRSTHHEPTYEGVPRSRSLWDRVPLEGRGEKWAAQKFVFVDEWRCITCWNCAAAAPKSFCIDADDQRARVFAQWGDDEEHLTAAVASCPVNCISWVNREDLQVLEYVTADEIHKSGVLFPRYGRQPNPFEMMESYRRQTAPTKYAQSMESIAKEAVTLHNRMGVVLAEIDQSLIKAAGWA